jgi:hypothetical protein
MNSTNRVLNRLLLVGVGLVLLAVGVAAAAAAFVTVVARAFDDASADVLAGLGDVLSQTPLVPDAADGAFGAGISWIPVALVGLFALAIILLLVFVFHQGRGHTGRVYSAAGPGARVSDPSSGPASAGRLLVESAVPQQALQEFLDGHPEIVSSRVSAYSVRTAPTLKVSVTCRRGVSPDDAARIVDDGLLALDGLLGVALPALVQLSGGFRAKTAKSTRLA